MELSTFAFSDGVLSNRHMRCIEITALKTLEIYQPIEPTHEMY